MNNFHGDIKCDIPRPIPSQHSDTVPGILAVVMEFIHGESENCVKWNEFNYRAKNCARPTGRRSVGDSCGKQIIFMFARDL